MKFSRKLLPVAMAVVFLAGVAAQATEAPAAARVILLANQDDPDSIRIAQHYADMRGVPRENIIAQSMPQAETITWPEFVTTIWQPLQDELVRRQWIDAIPMTLTDAVGRKKYVIAGHHISYLVVCRGVPLRILHFAEFYVPPASPQDRAEFRTNEGAVDSELSLLTQTNYPINGACRNPLFLIDHPSKWELSQVVKVSRLDGPTVEQALALVDHAMAAEQTGLLGRAYVDLAGRNPNGDRWLESAAAQLTELGFDVDVDHAPATFPITARFDAPVLYFGWYDEKASGPFTLPGFAFPPGAVAVHIHSFSAETLRSATARWCGPLVARGVTATVGNVFEPYLGFLHRPDFLLRALARGDTFGDAAYYAEPVLSWQAIAIGDPLYRPFARSFEDQWKDRANLPRDFAGYAALRELHLREPKRAAGQPLAADFGALTVPPNLALGLARARQRERAGDRAGAMQELAFAARLTAIRPDEWVLAHEAAQLLQRVGASGPSAQLYGRLLDDSELAPELREAWEPEAHAASDAAEAKK